MKQFTLEEYLKNPDRKVVTRNGESVRIMCTDYYGEKPIIAKMEESEYSYPFYEDGRFLSFGESSEYDLFFAPAKKEGWVNIFKVASNDNRYVEYARIFQSKEDADKEGEGYSGYITTLKIEWEE